MALSKNRPPRDYPNMNAMLGVALTLDMRPRNIAGASQPVPGSSSGLLLNKPVAIGTIPPGAFITSAGRSVMVAAAGAATVDIGTEAAPTRFFAAAPLSTTGYADGNSDTLGVVDAETVIYATLRGSTNLANCVAKIMLAFYAKND